jgi:endonuclease VIII
VPEGDTVFYAAERLRPALEGRVLTKTDFRVPAYATVDLSGRRLGEIATRGKHFLFRVEGGHTIHTHFGMEGEWIVHRPGERWRGPGHQARLVLENEKVVAVGFRLKVTEVIATAEEDRVLGHLGPDVLGADWDEEEVLTRLLGRSDEAIGEVLIDQTVMAGPGNVYKSEICFLSGVDPFTPVKPRHGSSGHDGLSGARTGAVGLRARGPAVPEMQDAGSPCRSYRSRGTSHLLVPGLPAERLISTEFRSEGLRVSHVGTRKGNIGNQ